MNKPVNQIELEEIIAMVFYFGMKFEEESAYMNDWSKERKDEAVEAILSWHKEEMLKVIEKIEGMKKEVLHNCAGSGHGLCTYWEYNQTLDDVISALKDVEKNI